MMCADSIILNICDLNFQHLNLLGEILNPKYMIEKLKEKLDLAKL